MSFDMTGLNFDGDVDDAKSHVPTTEERHERPDADAMFSDLQEWAESAVDRAAAQATAPAVFFDCETGPRPEDELRALFHEKTMDEFAASCDKRWKPDTVVAKYEEYKVKAWDEFVGRAALSPVTGRVLLIGTLRGKDFVVSGDANATETTMIESFWGDVEAWLAKKVPLIGHNSNAFDLPFLVRRSWLLDVSVPREVRQGRYWHPLFRDTMDWWACGGRDFVSLNTLGAFFGTGQKTEGVSGGDFAKLWFGTVEEHAKALEYNEQDLRLTAAIAAKMEMV